MGKKAKKWIVAAGVRSLKTFAQSMVSGITIGAALKEIDWGYIASVAVVAAIYSLATSLAGLPELKTESEGE